MVNICWLRRDLRLHDHFALSRALEEGPTLVVFIFDKHILEVLEDRCDRRVTFIHESLMEIEQTLKSYGSSLHVSYGDPVVEIPKIAKKFNVKKVFTNRDYEPYAKDRDQKVARELVKLEIEFEQFKDSVFFEKHEILTNQRGIYKVFTPYKNKWLETFDQQDRQIPLYETHFHHLLKWQNVESIENFDWWKRINFSPSDNVLKGGTIQAQKVLDHFKPRLDEYAEKRNFPDLSATSNMSVYIRFGNISVRDLLRTGTTSKSEGAKTWVSEIIWRDFYHMILDVFPSVAHGPFKPEYSKLKFPGSDAIFKAWCEGQTGYPIVDAAMRCLNQTGMMHNRLRMIVASFLCKTLLVDWRKGEKYFAAKLLDFDLAANNGGWQWSSSTGCDAQPYFRIFNPYSQSEKFDPQGHFIRKWVPELIHLSAKEIHSPDPLLSPNYPRPVASYELNRKKALELYGSIKN